MGSPAIVVGDPLPEGVGAISGAPERASVQVKTVVERSNALVHVVGLNPRTDHHAGGATVAPPASELREIAEASGGRFWVADSPARLQRAFAAVADAMRHRYVLRYEPQLVKREGWHRIDVRLERRAGDVEVRRGYWVAP